MTLYLIESRAVTIPDYATHYHHVVRSSPIHQLETRSVKISTTRSGRRYAFLGEWVQDLDDFFGAGDFAVKVMLEAYRALQCGESPKKVIGEALGDLLLTRKE